MPLYEYKCLKCKKSFEVLQKINTEPLEECIHCKGKVKKLISISSFQFKGNGWYITDYKNKNSNPDNNRENDSNEQTDTKKSSKINKNKNVTIK